MALQLAGEFVLVNAPDTGHVIRASGGQQFPVRAEAHREHGVLGFLEDQGGLAAVDVEHLDGPGPVRRPLRHGQPLSVVAEGHRVDEIADLPDADPLGERGIGEIPEQHFLVAPHGQYLAVGTEGQRGQGDRRAAGDQAIQRRGLGIARRCDDDRKRQRLLLRGGALRETGEQNARQAATAVPNACLIVISLS